MSTDNGRKGFIGFISGFMSTYNKNSAVAELTAHCCLHKSNFCISVQIPLFNVVFLSKLWEYHHKSYIAKTKLFGLHSVADSMGLTLSSST